MQVSRDAQEILEAGKRAADTGRTLDGSALGDEFGEIAIDRTL